MSTPIKPPHLHAVEDRDTPVEGFSADAGVGSDSMNPDAPFPWLSRRVEWIDGVVSRTEAQVELLRREQAAQGRVQARQGAKIESIEATTDELSAVIMRMDGTLHGVAAKLGVVEHEVASLEDDVEDTKSGLQRRSHADEYVQKAADAFLTVQQTKTTTDIQVSGEQAKAIIGQHDRVHRFKFTLAEKIVAGISIPSIITGCVYLYHWLMHHL